MLEVNPRMYSYVSYGLGIHSSLPLPELTTSAGAGPDIVIRLGSIGRPLPETDHTGSHFHSTADDTYLFWDEVGGFLVRDGREIIVDPLPGTAEKLLRLPLLGAVLSVAIHQRGLVGLHASAVAIDGHAVAFMGPSGLGKSTIAAALYARGHAVLADDLVVLDPSDNGGVMLLPSFPQLKLFPEAIIASLGDNPDLLPKLVPGLDKVARIAPKGFTTNPFPIKALYLLNNGSAFSVEPICPRDKISHLIRESYGARTFKHWLKGETASAHLKKCAQVANKVDFYLLKRPRSLEALPDVARMLEALLSVV